MLNTIWGIRNLGSIATLFAAGIAMEASKLDADGQIQLEPPPAKAATQTLKTTVTNPDGSKIISEEYDKGNKKITTKLYANGKLEEQITEEFDRINFRNKKTILKNSKDGLQETRETFENGIKKSFKSTSKYKSGKTREEIEEEHDLGGLKLKYVSTWSENGKDIILKNYDGAGMLTFIDITKGTDDGYISERDFFQGGNLDFKLILHDMNRSKLKIEWERKEAPGKDEEGNKLLITEKGDYFDKDLLPTQRFETFQSINGLTEITNDYDDENNLIRKAAYTSSYIKTPKGTYRMEADTITHEEFNEEKVCTHRNKTKFSYIYDESRFVQLKSITDESFNPKGKLLARVTETDIEVTSNTRTFERRIEEFDDKGKLINDKKSIEVKD